MQHYLVVANQRFVYVPRVESTICVTYETLRFMNGNFHKLTNYIVCMNTHESTLIKAIYSISLILSLQDPPHTSKYNSITLSNGLCLIRIDL